jgi:uncharacterized phiE125 gp8 family phage protein
MILEKDPYYNPQWIVSSAPVSEPVTVEELKLFARIDGDDENTLLESFITSARRLTEDYLNRALIEQTITLKMDLWPCEVIELPRPPLISITAVETLDESNVATVYASSNYYFDIISEPGLLILKNGVTPPQNTVRYYGGYQIRYKAGYGDAATDVPTAIRDCIKQWATAMYENRAVGSEPPVEIQPILSLFKVHYI